ncbi:MAG: sn-glycerol-3-phosphate ABC transporter ATP-binding protein UgpC, partial [Deltaproteobacteria bacterium]|nr:sn-glycerol-3-phosphate ABC transporter ATP-binding protein UgpC [Deltaproteobacteria bacterium]
MSEVTLSHVEKVYPDGYHAVRDFNLKIEDKQFVVFVGPSGCGKSTTLRMIAGLEDISSGELRIGDQRVNDVPPKNRDIAMVFQNYALYPHMTVYENMAFGLKLRGLPKAEVDKKVKDAAEFLGLQSMLERRPAALSGGQRQRVAVGRAVVRDPKCFLFDEPLSNLDARLRVQMRAEIKKLQARLGATTIYVTHDQEEAMTLGDRVVVMKDGVVQQIGAPLDIYRKPVNRFVAGFLGTPPMNFIAGRIAIADGGVWFDEGSFRLRLPPPQQSIAGGTSVVAGIRAHAFKLTSDAAAGFAAAAEVVEPLGEAVDVTFTAGNAGDLVARLPAESQVQPRDVMRLTVEPERIH